MDPWCCYWCMSTWPCWPIWVYITFELLWLYSGNFCNLELKVSMILMLIYYMNVAWGLVLSAWEAANPWEGNPKTTIPSRLPQGSSNEEPNPKWVINLSSKPLTPAQRSVLAKGPNFVVSPRQPSNLEYITAIEAACTKLSQQDAEEPRADINRVLRSSHPQTQPNQSSKLSFKGTKKGQGLHSSYCR